MKNIFILSVACLLSGCMSPSPYLCGIKGTPLKPEKVSASDAPCVATLKQEFQLKKEYIEYFSDKSTNHLEEAYATAFPIGHKHDFLKKKDDGYSYYLNVSLLGGLLFNAHGVFEFDSNGAPASGDLSMNTFSGLLSNQRAHFYIHEMGYEANANVSVQQSILSGLLYSEFQYFDFDKTIIVQEKHFLFKAFGVSKSKDGSRFLTFLWIPIKTSEPAK